jgi:hypothetical protein
VWLGVFACLSVFDAPHVARVSRRFRALFWASQARVRIDGAAARLAMCTDRTVAHIARLCSNLQALELTAGASDCPVQLSDLTFSSLVTHAPHLRRLACGVQANQFSDHGIARLAALSHLDSLSLASLPSVGNVGLAAIATMTTLTVLELGHVYVASAAGFAKLAALTNLVELRLAHCPQLSDGALASILSRCTSLRRVGLVSCPWLSNTVARHLAPLANLRRVDLADCSNRMTPWSDAAWPLALQALVHDEKGDRSAARPATLPLTSATIPPPPTAGILA